jgi:hypothetical protein
MDPKIKMITVINDVGKPAGNTYGSGRTKNPAKK